MVVGFGPGPDRYGGGYQAGLGRIACSFSQCRKARTPETWERLADRGEGMKWDNSFKKLVETSLRAGRPVLWMVSGEGQVDWPWESLALDDLPEVRLRTRNWIGELDDRLADTE